MSANSINTMPQLGLPDHPSAFEIRFGQPWTYELDRIPGSRAFVHHRNTNKFATRALSGIYLGRADCSMLKRGYVVLLAETGKLVISASVYVQETNFPPFNDAIYCSRDEDLPVEINPLMHPASMLGDSIPAADFESSSPQDKSAGDKQTDPPATHHVAASTPVPPSAGADLDDDDDVEDLPVHPTIMATVMPAHPQPSPVPPSRPSSPPLSPITAASSDSPSPASEDEIVIQLQHPQSDPEDDDFVPTPESYVTADSSTRVLRTAAERHPVVRLFDPVSFVSTANIGTINHQPHVPTSVKAALQGHDNVKWRAAIDAEFANLRDMGVFTEIPRADADEIILNSVWVFKIKQNGIYKARLAACGYGAGRMPLSEVFAPTVSTKTLLILLALSSIYRAKLSSFDVVSAFMHGKMDGRKNRYAMRLPAGYIKLDPSARFLRLLGSINGLKEASQIWSDLLASHLISMDFKPTAADPCLYIKHFDNSQFIIISIHVDDGLTAYTVSDDIFDIFCARLTVLLDNRIKWGSADEYLAMDLRQSSDRSTIKLSMESYIGSVLADLFGTTRLRAYDTPAATDTVRRMRSDRSSPLSAGDKQEYLKLVGILNYIRKARPDIEFATSLVAARVSAPTSLDMEIALRIFGYLKGTISLGRTFNGDKSMMGLSDSDFGNTNDGYNYSGSLIMLGGSAVVSSTKKQSVVTTATADAELIALSSVVRSVDETLVLLNDLNVPVTYPVPVLCDNQATVLTATTLSSRKSRHLAIAAAYVRDHTLRRRTISVQRVSTSDNLSDFFTKPLPHATFSRFRKHIMLGEPFKPSLLPQSLTRK
jgi:hypothetical protein